MYIRNKHVKMAAKTYDMLVKAAKVDEHINPGEMDEDGNYINDGYPYAPNDVYMLGQNKKGIINKAIKVSDIDDGGCEFMPRIKTETLTDAYLELARTGHIAIGYAITIPIAQRVSDPSWYSDGQGFLQTPNLLVVDFCPKPLAIQWNSKVDDEQTVIIHKVKNAK